MRWLRPDVNLLLYPTEGELLVEYTRQYHEHDEFHLCHHYQRILRTDRIEVVCIAEVSQRRWPWSGTGGGARQVLVQVVSGTVDVAMESGRSARLNATDDVQFEVTGEAHQVESISDRALWLYVLVEPHTRFAKAMKMA